MKVTPLSVAEKSGLQAGDVISDVGGTPVRKIADVAAFMGKINPSAKVDITFSRADEAKKLKAEFEGPVKSYEILPQATCIQEFHKIDGYGQPVRTITFGRNESPPIVKN